MIYSIKKINGLILGLLFFSVWVGYNPEAKGQSQIQGTYHVSVSKTEELIAGSTKSKYDSLNSEAKSRARASLGDREFRFSEGGALEVKWKVNGSEKAVTGKWELRANGAELALNVNGTETIYQLSRPDANSLVLHNEKGNGLYNTLYLTKQ